MLDIPILPTNNSRNDDRLLVLELIESTNKDPEISLEMKEDLKTAGTTFVSLIKAFSYILAELIRILGTAATTILKLILREKHVLETNKRILDDLIKTQDINISELEPIRKIPKEDLATYASDLYRAYSVIIGLGSINGLAAHTRRIAHLPNDNDGTSEPATDYLLTNTKINKHEFKQSIENIGIYLEDIELFSDHETVRRIQINLVDVLKKYIDGVQKNNASMNELGYTAHNLSELVATKLLPLVKIEYTVKDIQNLALQLKKYLDKMLRENVVDPSGDPLHKNSRLLFISSNIKYYTLLLMNYMGKLHSTLTLSNELLLEVITKTK